MESKEGPLLTVRPIDCGPGSDIPSRDVVCRPSVPAGPTAKAVATATVRARDVSAERTGLARVSRVDWNNGYPSHLCFVLEKAAKLIKSPIGHTWTLSARGRCPRANAFEILNSNGSVGAFRLFHNSFGNTVVYVALIAGLSARDGAELPRRRPTFLPLEIAASMRKDSSNLLDHLAGIAIPVGIVCDVDNSQIDTNSVDRRNLRRFFNTASHSDIEFAALHLKVDLAFSVDQHLSLILTADEGNLDAAINGPDRDGVVVAETKYAVIERLCRCWSESVLMLLVSFVTGRNLADGQNDKLCGKSCSFPNGMVNEMVDRVTCEGTVFPCGPADLVAGGVSRPQRFQQRFLLLFCWQKLNGSNNLHVTHVSIPIDANATYTTDFLHRLKAVVSVGMRRDHDLGNIPTLETFHYWLSQAEKTVTHHKSEEMTPDENEENDG